MKRHLKRSKIKSDFKLWEKIFIISSITVIVFCIIFYSCRMIHYYKEEHKIINSTSNDLFTRIIQDNGTVVVGTGLYNEGDNYYFKGSIESNYVYYSGRLWRVISIDKDSIRLIANESQTSIAWGKASTFEESYINQWLNGYENTTKFIDSLNDYRNMLNQSKFCVDSVKLDSVTCNKVYTNYAGLLSVDEYLRAGGKESFINNGTYFWLSNTSLDNKVWYVFNEGGINDNSSSAVSYMSYGVRPVISIKKNIVVNGGSGSKENPYYLDSLDNSIVSSLSIGGYINYSNYLWRIIEKNDNYVKILMDDYLKIDTNYIKFKYIYDSTSKKVTTIKRYLNNDFYNKLDKTKLSECNFYIGSYEDEDYKKIYSTTSSLFVGIQNVGELFNTSDEAVWLYTNVDSRKQMAYTTIKGNLLFLDNTSNENYIRPVVCLKKETKINAGNGLYDNPYVVEANNEVSN